MPDPGTTSLLIGKQGSNHYRESRVTKRAQLLVQRFFMHVTLYPGTLDHNCNSMNHQGYIPMMLYMRSLIIIVKLSHMGATCKVGQATGKCALNTDIGPDRQGGIQVLQVERCDECKHQASTVLEVMNARGACQLSQQQ
jgi:hypothetical protein